MNVIIEVRQGIAHVLYKDKGINLVIRDVDVFDEMLDTAYMAEWHEDEEVDEITPKWSRNNQPGVVGN